jgi:small-conductance mechanosensitive channel
VPAWRTWASASPSPTEGPKPRMARFTLKREREKFPQARAALDELLRQLESMPEAQREMMKQMMGEQMQMMERVAAGGAMELEIRVTELQVNAGPPGG